MAMNLIQKSQIKTQVKSQIKNLTQAQVGALLFGKAFIKIPLEYFKYSNIFSAKNIVELLEYTKINNYDIDLKKGKQLLFGSIYSLRLIELKTLKTYIKTNLVNYFIQTFKFFTRAFIFFDQKLNSSFCFYIDYQGLNNLIKKN